MTHHYPTFTQLRAMGETPEPLYIGSHEALQAFGARAGVPKPIRAEKEPLPEADKPPVRKHRRAA